MNYHVNGCIAKYKSNWPDRPLTGFKDTCFLEGKTGLYNLFKRRVDSRTKSITLLKTNYSF